MRRVRAAFLMAAACLAVPLALIAGTMKQTVTQIAVPADATPIPLEGLAYKAWFTADLTSARLEAVPAPGTSPVELKWILTGVNTDAQMHRVSISVTLLDESGAKLATGSETTAIRPGAKDQSITVKMKVPASAWSAAKSVRVSASWFS